MKGYIVATTNKHQLGHHFMELQKLNSLDLTPPKLSNSEMLSFLASLNLPTKKLVKARNKKSNRKVPQAPIIDLDELPTEADMAYLRGEY